MYPPASRARFARSGACSRIVAAASRSWASSAGSTGPSPAWSCSPRPGPRPRHSPASFGTAACGRPTTRSWRDGFRRRSAPGSHGRMPSCGRGAGGRAPPMPTATSRARRPCCGPACCAVLARCRSSSSSRRHQLRAQLADHGCPIVGDRLYGARLPFAGIALHAAALAFDHPTTRQPLTLAADVPAAWRGRFAAALDAVPARPAIDWGDSGPGRGDGSAERDDGE
jgi:hypothetical protein